MPRYYKNNTSVETEDKASYQLNCNSLDLQNTGTTAVIFDGLYIAPGTGRTFPAEVEGEMCVYQRNISIVFTGGSGELRINQITYSREN